MADNLFKNERDRSDFFIAIAVLALFGSVLFGKRFFKSNPLKAQAAVISTELDSDNDGILDIDDKCPTQYGTKKGCPQDADNDGVYNYMDECPSKKGTADNYGCPENIKVDSSTLKNVNKDNLVAKAGTAGLGAAVVANDGSCAKKKGTCLAECKQRCENSIKACQENCTTEECKKKCEEDVKANCQNKKKACAKVHETCKSKCAKKCDKNDKKCTEDCQQQCIKKELECECPGCPNKNKVAAMADSSAKDSDNDGVTDENDKCPLTPGVASNNGCPVEKVAVELDEEDAKIITEAVRDVQFETAKDVLKPNSKTILNKVAQLMEKYPDAKLDVHGHTDNDGKNVTNQNLSERRAASCKAYLVSKGISADRIFTKGFGESQPIATNDTAEGRRKNRRVEFNLYN